jgi:hypothetical protein
VNCIDEHERAHFVSHPCSPGDITDRSKRVRRRANGNHFCPGIHDALEIIPVELPGFRDHSHGANTEIPVLCDLPPWIRVRMMIELRDDDLIALRKRAPDRA